MPATDEPAQLLPEVMSRVATLGPASLQAVYDDNKFADCAITANADDIITNDRHFDPLRGSGYRPQPISPADFISRHLSA